MATIKELIPLNCPAENFKGGPKAKAELANQLRAQFENQPDILARIDISLFLFLSTGAYIKLNH